VIPTVVTIAAIAITAPVLAAQRPPCPPMDSTATWARVNREWSADRNRGWSNDSLRLVLLALEKEDQAARRDFGALTGDTAYFRRLVAADSVRSATLIAIIDKVGLPTRSMVGPDGAAAVMLMVQHAVPALQERVLDMTKALAAGEISPPALAMLEDRVLVHQGRRQRFGTHFTLAPEGVFRFAPTDDLAGLAARRDAAGLPPLNLYVCLMEEAGMRIDRSSLPSVRGPARQPPG
jgi:hypothetical protein